MFSHRLITLTTTAIGTAAIGLAAIGFAGTAEARVVKSLDESFLTEMQSLGISFPSPQEAVRSGHQVCIQLAAGNAGTDVTAQIARQTNLTSGQATQLVNVATNVYCPQLSG